MQPCFTRLYIHVCIVGMYSPSFRQLWLTFKKVTDKVTAGFQSGSLGWAHDRLSLARSIPSDTTSGWFNLPFPSLFFFFFALWFTAIQYLEYSISIYLAAMKKSCLQVWSQKTLTSIDRVPTHTHNLGNTDQRLFSHNPGHPATQYIWNYLHTSIKW